MPGYEQELEREARHWEARGLSLVDAERRLVMVHSTVYPVATHCALWIREHWSESQVAQLPAGALAMAQNTS
ncbi:hypothetical protein NOR53_1859 [gamma proteobacterium NOR5-3]|nr:hypothetical protein NOR53_1859 [gamma proteobacterium NOR5-3]